MDLRECREALGDLLRELLDDGENRLAILQPLANALVELDRAIIALEEH